MTTHWSVVLAAGRKDTARAHDALAKLCETYWYPLYAYVRQRGYSPHDAQDLTQEFFARLLKKNPFGTVTRDKGKFRSFLLTALNHFLVDEWKKAGAQKRGGGRVVSLDARQAETRFGREPVDTLTPQRLFEQNWALALLEAVYGQLEREYEADGKGALFRELKSCLTAAGSSLSYADLAVYNSPKSKSLLTGVAIGVASCLVIGVMAVVVWLAVYFFAGRGPHPAPAAAQETASATQLAQDGWRLWQARRVPEAIAKFQEAVNLAPNDANAWNGLGWASFNSGRSEDAEKAFLKTVELEPNHPAALNGLGQLYLSQRKYDQAESHLLKAAPQAPAAWYGLARLYLVQGKFTNAEPWARKIVDSGQADETARKMLEAAENKKLSDGLRLMIEPPPAP